MGKTTVNGMPALRETDTFDTFMVKTVEFARVEQHAFFSQGLLRKIWLRAVSSQDNWFDVQAVFRGNS